MTETPRARPCLQVVQGSAPPPAKRELYDTVAYSGVVPVKTLERDSAPKRRQQEDTATRLIRAGTLVPSGRNDGTAVICTEGSWFRPLVTSRRRLGVVLNSASSDPLYSPSGHRMVMAAVVSPAQSVQVWMTSWVTMVVGIVALLGLLLSGACIIMIASRDTPTAHNNTQPVHHPIIVPGFAGVWVSPSNGTIDPASCPLVTCPTLFPFPSRNPDYSNHVAIQDAICWNNRTNAILSPDPACGSWCTKDVKVGAGCDIDNLSRRTETHMCPTQAPAGASTGTRSGMPNMDANACLSACMAHGMCNAYHLEPSGNDDSAGNCFLHTCFPDPMSPSPPAPPEPARCRGGPTSCEMVMVPPNTQCTGPYITNKRVQSLDACKSLCLSDDDCTAVKFNPHVRECTRYVYDRPELTHAPISERLCGSHVCYSVAVKCFHGEQGSTGCKF
jgi:hypothetical protein